MNSSSLTCSFLGDVRRVPRVACTEVVSGTSFGATEISELFTGEDRRATGGSALVWGRRRTGESVAGQVQEVQYTEGGRKVQAELFSRTESATTASRSRFVPGKCAERKEGRNKIALSTKDVYAQAACIPGKNIMDDIITAFSNSSKYSRNDPFSKQRSNISSTKAGASFGSAWLT